MVIGGRAAGEGIVATQAAPPLRRVSLGEARGAFERLPVRAMPAENVALEDAAGRVAAADVRSPEDVPPFDRSRVDGYAVVSSDVRSASEDAPVALRVAFEVRMGEAAGGTVASGTCARIPTGGAMPAGADAVVMREDTVEAPDVVQVRRSSEAGESVTKRGADLRASDVAIERGTVLQPASLGLLAAIGAARVDVRLQPHVRMLITGDEVVAPDQPVHAGQIRDINSYSIGAALRALRCVVSRAHVTDERDGFASALRTALVEADAVVISGSSSAGDKDHAPGVIAELCSPGVIVHGVRVKPGRPALLALADDVPIIGLPGNPVSALVMFELLVRPTIARMLGARDEAVIVSAALTSPIAREANVEQRVPVRLRRTPDGWTAQPLLGTSAQMHILAWADALVAVASGDGDVPAGSRVEATLLTRAGELR